MRRHVASKDVGPPSNICKLPAQLIVNLLNERHCMSVVKWLSRRVHLHPIGYVMSIFLYIRWWKGVMVFVRIYGTRIFGLRSWSVLDVAIYCLIIWYDKYLGMISITVGVIMARTPSWWSHQESILTVHIYLHNISRNKLIKSINKQTQTSINIFYLLLQSTNY